METSLLDIEHWIIEHFMIAPIILHASYDLYHPHFFGQLGTILALALTLFLPRRVVFSPATQNL